MKKILFISNLSNKITNFSIPSIYAGQRLGYEVHLAANYEKFDDDPKKYNVVIHHLDIDRNPFNRKNITAYRQLLKLIEEEKFDVIHCNTPIGGVLGRLGGVQTGVEKIIYTAHGFHFYRGAPLINNTLYKGVEKILARFTDSIITINEEDYDNAQNFKLRNNGNVYYVPGVGVDTSKYQLKKFDREAERNKLGFKSEDILLISMGDLIERKNYSSSIEAVAKTDNKKIHFLICGEGPEKEELKALARNLNVENQIHFLGFRSDIRELLNLSDIFLFTTFQEGLPRSMMEAMSSGLPCIASDIRGNNDLIEDKKGGFLFHPNDIEGISEAINLLANDAEIREKMKRYNLERIKKFDIENVKKEIFNIYIKELS